MRTSRTRKKLASIAMLILTTAACTEEDGASALCGEGQTFSFQTQQYCLYEVPITEQGFSCPDTHPTEFSFDDFRACAMNMMLPEGFEEEAHTALFMDEDSSTPDATIVADAGETMDSTTADGGDACTEAWASPQQSVSAPSTPADSEAMRISLSYGIQNGNAFIILDDITAETVARSSDGPFSIETHSGHWAELRDAADQTLYTRQVSELISESVEAPGPGGGFSRAYICPEDGFIRFSNMENPATATQLVLFQDAIDGASGPTIEFARFDLAGR